MPIAIGATNGITLTDTDGTKRQFILRVVPSHGDNLIEAVVLDGTGTELGTPIRFKMSNSGHRIAADLPGVSSEFFITQDGHITNG
jgi:hypothetical protein